MDVSRISNPETPPPCRSPDDKGGPCGVTKNVPWSMTKGRHCSMTKGWPRGTRSTVARLPLAFTWMLASCWLLAHAKSHRPRLHLHLRVKDRTGQLQEQPRDFEPMPDVHPDTRENDSPLVSASELKDSQHVSGEQFAGGTFEIIDRDISVVERAKRKGWKPWPAVYLYRLDPPFTKLPEHSSENYQAEIDMPKWLNRHGFIVEDPEEADLFLPLVYHYHAFADYIKEQAKGEGDQTTIIRDAYKIVMSQYPYWNRSGGVDHIWTFTQDHGFCGFAGNGEMVLREIQPSIIFSHWGLMREERLCFFEDVIKGVRCEHKTTTQRLPCFIPSKDTLIPNSYWVKSDDVQEDLLKWDPHRFRGNLVFLAASAVMRDVYYSHGVRQTFFRLFRNEPNWKLVQSDSKGDYTDLMEDYELQFQNSTFCVAATGSGFGVRAKLAVMNGCIPIIIADAIQLELEDVLPWPEFSLRLPQYMMYRLPEALMDIMMEPGKVKEMQRKVACVWRWFSWKEPYGRAGEGVLCSLRRKLAGWDVLKPSIDWETCTLLCDVPEELRRRALKRRRLSEASHHQMYQQKL